MEPHFDNDCGAAVEVQSGRDPWFASVCCRNADEARVYFECERGPDKANAIQAVKVKLAGKAALAFDEILAKHTRQIGDSELLELYNRYNEFVHLSARAGVSTSPKTHLMYHCIHRAFERGNPRAYTTYVDESYNGAIAKVCRSVHRATWAVSVYRKLEQLESLQGKYVEDFDFREA